MRRVGPLSIIQAGRGQGWSLGASAASHQPRGDFLISGCRTALPLWAWSPWGRSVRCEGLVVGMDHINPLVILVETAVLPITVDGSGRLLEMDPHHASSLLCHRGAARLCASY